MDLSNVLGDLLGGGGKGQTPAAAVAGVQGLIDQHGGVNGLLDKLRAGGLGGAVDSWVSIGPNEPVEPNQLASALGPDTLRSLSESVGLPIQSLLPLLATFLPALINHLTPGGTAPKSGDAANQPDLGGLLGGLLGGGGLGGLFGDR